MKQKLIRGAGYGLFFVLAFGFSLYLTFDPMLIKGWLESNAQKSGIGLNISQLDKYRLSGVKASQVTLTTPRGMTLKIDQMRARLALLPLLLGRKQFGFALSLYGGKISGSLEQARRGYKTRFEAENVDLARMPAGGGGGPWLASKLNATGDLNLSPRNNPKSWSGKIAAEFGPGKIPAFAYQGFQVPEIRMDRAKLELELNNGSAQFKSLELQSPDFPIRGGGTVELRDPMPESQISLEAKINPSEQYLEQVPMLQGLVSANKTITYHGTIAGIISGR